MATALILFGIWFVIFAWTWLFFAGAARLRRRAAELDGDPEVD